MKNIFVKQESTGAARYFNYYGTESSPNITVHPNADHKRYVRKEADGRTWVTGFNENSPRVRSITDETRRKKVQKEIIERRTRLENALGVSLSANPNPNPDEDFWLNHAILLVPRGGGDIVWDLDDPMTEVFYYAAIENRFIAPEYDKLKAPEYKEASCFLYFFNPQNETSRQNTLMEMKDEIAALIHAHKDNKEKLYMWASVLKCTVNRNMDRDSIARVFGKHREKLKSEPELTAFHNILTLDNEKLFIRHLVTWALRYRKIVKNQNYYMFNEIDLGKTLTEVEESLLSGDFDDVVEQLTKLENPSK